jgi:hypothetical protein
LGTLEDMLKKAPDMGISLHRGTISGWGKPGIRKGAHIGGTLNDEWRKALGTGHLSPRGLHEGDLEGGLLYLEPWKKNYRMAVTAKNQCTPRKTRHYVHHESHMGWSGNEFRCMWQQEDWNYLSKNLLWMKRSFNNKSYDGFHCQWCEAEHKFHFRKVTRIYKNN